MVGEVLNSTQHTVMEETMCKLLCAAHEGTMDEYVIAQGGSWQSCPHR